MSFESAAAQPGRLAYQLVEVDYPFCANTYGVSPCTATVNRHNLLTRANDLSHADWTKVRLSVTADAEAAPVVPIPDAVADANGDEVTPNTENSSHILRQVFSIAAQDGTLCFSVYGKANGYTGLLLEGHDDTAGPLGRAECDLVTGAIRAISGEVLTIGAEPAGGGWFRFWAAYSGFGADTTPRMEIRIVPSFGTGDVAWTGDGVSGVFLWGPQMTRGTRPGLYTPTAAAAIDGGGEVKGLCHNTFATCQDEPNYVEEGKTLLFAPVGQIVPAGVEAIPAVTDISWASTVLKPGEGLGARASVRVQLQDQTDPDHLLDKYDAERQAEGEAKGTLFGKIKARQPFLAERALRVREGYVSADGTFAAETRVRHYIIDDVSGPDDGGAVSVTAKDILKLADDKRARAPVESTGRLVNAIDDQPTTTTLDVTPGTGPDYDVDKHISVDEEVMEITNRSVDQLTVVRAAGGSEIAAHDAEALVQSCFTAEDEPVIEIQQRLYRDFAGIDASFIPFTDWQAEQTLSLDDYKLSVIIPKPEGVTKLIKEIDEATLIDNWWEEVDREIKLKLQTPFQEEVPVLTDGEHFIAESIAPRDRNDLRLSRAIIWYGPRNYMETGDPKDMAFARGNIEIDKEGVNKYGKPRTKQIVTRWLRGPTGPVGTQDNTTAAELTVQRLTDRFGLTPQEFTFLIDAKDVDAIRVGDVVDIRSRVLSQDAHGDLKPVRMQIVEARPDEAAHRYRMKALGFFRDPGAVTGETITANTQALDLFVLFGGPPNPIEATVTIDTGIFVYGGAGGPAVTTGNLHPDSKITLVNKGEIIGGGGPGGAGGDGNMPGSAGGPGGPGIETFIGELTIDNTGGAIRGGAGGGGGGDGGGGVTQSGGGGGGGGRGHANPPGGPGGQTTGLGSDGADGGAGSLLAGGAGGAAGGLGAGDGGDGSSAYATAGGASPDGAAGGAAGAAIETNGNTVTFTATGTIEGDIV